MLRHRLVYANSIAHLSHFVNFAPLIRKSDRSFQTCLLSPYSYHSAKEGFVQRQFSLKLLNSAMILCFPCRWAFPWPADGVWRSLISSLGMIVPAYQPFDLHCAISQRIPDLPVRVSLLLHLQHLPYDLCSKPFAHRKIPLLPFILSYGKRPFFSMRQAG